MRYTQPNFSIQRSEMSALFAVAGKKMKYARPAISQMTLQGYASVAAERVRGELGQAHGVILEGAQLEHSVEAQCMYF